MGYNFGNSFFSHETKQYPAQTMPVWIEVRERKTAGGTVDISKHKKGDLIALGVPVRLNVMGGEAQFLDSFEVMVAVGSSDTSLSIKPISNAVIPAAGLIVGKADASGNAAKAVALSGTPTVANGVYTFTISANALGELAKGDILYIISEAGSNKKAVLPTGLSWRQIYIDSENAYKGTVSVVTKGQILGDRIAPVPDFYKAAMPGITFDYELSE